MIYDIAIIGAGPAGYTAAEQASKKGLSTLLFEKKTIGGVCLNEGCIPTKALLYSAKILDQATHADRYGILVDKPSFDLKKIFNRKNKIVKKLTAGVRFRLKKNKVVIVNAKATIEQQQAEDLFTLCAEDTTYQAKNLLVCTGSENVIPPIKGLEQTDYWTSTEALELKELPSSITIVGGGVIGMEFAAFFNTMGVKVNVVEMLDSILGPMDKELSTTLQEMYTKKGINFYLKHKVTSIENGAVHVQTSEGKELTLTCDKIVLSVGRRPITKGFGLEKLHLKQTQTGIQVNEFMQSSIPHVYICGDLTGFSLLAHTAVTEAQVAIDHIVGQKHPMHYYAIPSVVYTNPEIASVGETEETLKAKRIEYTSKKIPMAYAGRFVAENERENGICKILLDKEDKLLGVHILGNPASELIVTAALAIEQGLTATQITHTTFPHPTVSEIFKETLLS